MFLEHGLCIGVLLRIYLFDRYDIEDVTSYPYEIVKEQKIMDLSGLEPLTSCLQSRRSTS